MSIKIKVIESSTHQELIPPCDDIIHPLKRSLPSATGIVELESNERERYLKRKLSKEVDLIYFYTNIISN